MTVSVADFRAAFPEFVDPTTYPDAQVTFWLTQAGFQINVGQFGQSADLATMLFVAHNLVLSAQAARASATSGGLTTGGGVVSSKSVGPVSKSYDTTLGTVEGAGYWNLTNYGTRLYQLMQAFLGGPFYVPGQSARAPISGPYSGGHWPYWTNS